MNNREIERKFVVTNFRSHHALNLALSELLEAPVSPMHSSLDRFWLHSRVDFIRFRESGNFLSGEITVKKSDKGNTVDRIEENMMVRRAEGLAHLILLYGEPVKELAKEYTLYFKKLETRVAIVSSYRVIGDNRLFLEVEAPTLVEVDDTLKVLSGLKLESEPRSLFTIFYKENQ